MIWFLLALGFFLLLMGVLSQVYSLKTKRGLISRRSEILRVVARLAVALAGVALIAVAAGRIVLHR